MFLLGKAVRFFEESATLVILELGLCRDALVRVVDGTLDVPTWVDLICIWTRHVRNLKPVSATCDMVRTMVTFDWLEPRPFGKHAVGKEDAWSRVGKAWEGTWLVSSSIGTD